MESNKEKKFNKYERTCILALKKADEFVITNVDIMAEHFAKISSTANYSGEVKEHERKTLQCPNLKGL